MGEEKKNLPSCFLEKYYKNKQRVQDDAKTSMEYKAILRLRP